MFTLNYSKVVRIKMKQKVSISLGEDTLKKVEEKLTEGLFRNKSHIIEYSVNKFLEKDNEQPKL